MMVKLSKIRGPDAKRANAAAAAGRSFLVPTYVTGRDIFGGGRNSNCLMGPHHARR